MLLMLVRLKRPDLAQLQTRLAWDELIPVWGEVTPGAVRIAVDLSDEVTHFDRFALEHLIGGRRRFALRLGLALLPRFPRTLPMQMVHFSLSVDTFPFITELLRMHDWSLDG